MENFNKFSKDKNLLIKNCFDDSIKNDNLLSKLITKLDNIFKKENKNFAELCFITYRIKKLFEDYNQSGFWVYNNKDILYSFDSIMQGFGLDSTQTSRLLSCYDKFCYLSCSDLDKSTCNIITEFEDFSKSKLFELLTIPNEQILKDLQTNVIRADMTIKQLLEYVKNYKALQKQNSKLDNESKEEQTEEIEEDIPEAYNPKQHYDFEYFEEKNKAQLLNIVWDLQKEYERLKKEIKK